MDFNPQNIHVPCRWETTSPYRTQRLKNELFRLKKKGFNIKLRVLVFIYKLN
jgi:hypothetical protein